MHRAIDKLSITPEFLIIDGNRFKPYSNLPHQCIVKGDGKYLNIAAASILAKTHRDEYMDGIALEYPLYDWSRNKGYPTEAHRDAVLKHGFSPYHRKTFQVSKPQLTLKF